MSLCPETEVFLFGFADLFIYYLNDSMCILFQNREFATLKQSS